MMKLKLFGKPQICLSSNKVNIKSKRVYAILALAQAQENSISRKELQQYLWIASDEPQSGNYANRLRVLLYSMKHYRSHFLDVTDNDVSFVAQKYTDVEEFKLLLEQDSLLASKEAIDLYDGDFLQGIEISSCSAKFKEWLQSQRSFYQEKVTKLLDLYITELLKGRRSTDTAELDHYLKKSLAINPLRNELQLQLAQFYINLRQPDKAILSLENHLNKVNKLSHLDGGNEIYRLLKELKNFHPT